MMNWFQRYGIPGAYFVGLIITGIYALYPEISHCWDPQAVAGLALIAFLPIGYILSVIQQGLYLRDRRIRFITGRRTHREAMDRLEIPFLGFLDQFNEPIENEGIIEARTLLLGMLHTRAMPLENHKFIRDWISRRADVNVINSSIILANLLVIIIFALLLIPYHANFGLNWLWVFPPIMITVTLVMWFNRRILEDQIIEVIAGLYRRHVNDM